MVLKEQDSERYKKRVAACLDEQLAETLLHGRDEENGHAAMLFEWMREDINFNKELKGYLFSDSPIAYG